MSAKYTPGPWKLHFWAENVAVSSDRPKARDCETVATIYRGPETSIDRSIRETADANARLIAAAPDYHEIALALVELIEQCSTCEGSGENPRRKGDACRVCGGVGEVFRQSAAGEIGPLRAAIAKARGER